MAHWLARMFSLIILAAPAMYFAAVVLSAFMPSPEGTWGLTTERTLAVLTYTSILAASVAAIGLAFTILLGWSTAPLTMKRRNIIAMAIGIFFSMILLAIAWQMPGGILDFLQAPGIIAIMLLFGPHGPVSSDILALAIAGAVNAIAYGLLALALAVIFDNSNRDTSRRPDVR
ncbi:hypothetical protein JQ628_27715 [Bradyrhizobium lablabi]|uniref:hypothetical protein n=1 Tax=Bradyrhizobium lablabi TaxID=722472 RepID=UPI001BA8988B|nr:hypothetical protein [Bradyrhizobium lablabi]MBR1125338.1 hypothetical protein [Bradyrhizobium lablabi]